jgi:ribonuclease-3
VLGRRRRLTPLEESLRYRFRRPELLELALTHRSFANEQGLPGHYERLEFLGDAVLAALAAEWLYERHPELPEGELSKLKSALVAEPPLATYAQSLGLGEALHLGVGEERSGGRRKPSLLADALEAIFAALWLDGGLPEARRAVRSFLEEASATQEELREADAKTRLQELVQSRGWERPAYQVVAEAGPDHSKSFAVVCRVRGEVAGEGEGPSKKIAEQRAAARALDRLGERSAAGTVEEP